MKDLSLISVGAAIELENLRLFGEVDPEALPEMKRFLEKSIADLKENGQFALVEEFHYCLAYRFFTEVMRLRFKRSETVPGAVAQVVEKLSAITEDIKAMLRAFASTRRFDHVANREKIEALRDFCLRFSDVAAEHSRPVLHRVA